MKISGMINTCKLHAFIHCYVKCDTNCKWDHSPSKQKLDLAADVGHNFYSEAEPSKFPGCIARIFKFYYYLESKWGVFPDQLASFTQTRGNHSNLLVTKPYQTLTSQGGFWCGALFPTNITWWLHETSSNHSQPVVTRGSLTNHWACMNVADWGK